MTMIGLETLEISTISHMTSAWPSHPGHSLHVLGQWSSSALRATSSGAYMLPSYAAPTHISLPSEVWHAKKLAFSLATWSQKCPEESRQLGQFGWKAALSHPLKMVDGRVVIRVLRESIARKMPSRPSGARLATHAD